MDEFADLEKELHEDSKIQSLDIIQIIQSIESDEAPLGFEFTPYEIIWTPASSIGCLLLGIILSPLLIGFLWLWIFFYCRPKIPIMENSHLYQCQFYPVYPMQLQHHQINQMHPSIQPFHLIPFGY